MKDKYPNEDRIRFQMYMVSDNIRQALKDVPRSKVLAVFHRVMSQATDLRKIHSQQVMFQTFQQQPELLGKMYHAIAEALEKEFNLDPTFSREEYECYITMVMAEELDKIGKPPPDCPLQCQGQKHPD